MWKILKIGVMTAGKWLDLSYLYYMLSSNSFFCLIVALIAIFLDLGHFGKKKTIAGYLPACGLCL